MEVDLQPIKVALPSVTSRRLIKTATDEQIVIFAEEAIINEGGSAIDGDDLIDYVKEWIADDHRQVTSARVIKVINANTGPEKTFMRFYSWYGPVALTRKVMPIIKAIKHEAENDSNDLASVVDQTPSFANPGGVHNYDDSVQYLYTIQDMIKEGYLELDNNMKLTLDNDLVYMGSLPEDEHEGESEVEMATGDGDSGSSSRSVAVKHRDRNASVSGSKRLKTNKQGVYYQQPI